MAFQNVTHRLIIKIRAFIERPNFIYLQTVKSTLITVLQSEFCLNLLYGIQSLPAEELNLALYLDTILNNLYGLCIRTVTEVSIRCCSLEDRVLQAETLDNCCGAKVEKLADALSNLTI